jgi:Mg-chelatase subunit ChlD
MRTGMSLRLCAALVGACVLVSVAPMGAWSAGQSGADYVLLVDCTGSMQYSGRGAATLEAVDEFVGSLNSGDRITVYGYGEEPFPAMTAYPVTVGSEAERRALCAGLKLPFTADRTDITRGLDLVWRERQKAFSRALSEGAKAPAGSAYVVLLTDGKLIPVYSDYSQYDAIYAASMKRLRELTGLFAEAGVPVYSVGLGSAEKVDGELLTQISKATGGVYRHAASSVRLAGVFSEVIDDVIGQPVAVAEVPGSTPSGGEEALMVAEPVVETTEARSGSILDDMVETASAGEPGRTSRTEVALSQSFGSLGRQIYQSIVGVLGVVMGFVAIGIHRHQAWTGAFTKPLLQKEIRVKGYLRRVLPEGVIAAHRNIPIENPGLPMIEIGVGTDYAAELRETLLEFAGTADGSPPVLRVLKGSVRVAGEPLEDARALVDGDIIECEGKAYKYLRGQRM